jgi:hypothetical protein
VVGRAASKLTMVAFMFAAVRIGAAWLPTVSRETVIREDRNGPATFTTSHLSLLGSDWTVALLLVTPAVLACFPWLWRNQPSARRVRVSAAAVLGSACCWRWRESGCSTCQRGGDDRFRGVGEGTTAPRFPVGGRRRSASGAGRCRCVLNDAGIDGYLTTQPNVVVDLLKDDT